MIDHHNRTIDYMRISVTDRCNLRCRYCMPEDIPSIPHEEILSFEEILHICRLAADLGIRKFKVTGGEPLVRKGCLDFIQNLKQLPGVSQVTITTNGVLLAESMPRLRTIRPDGINISLDTLRADTFHHITQRPYLPQVMEGIHACVESGIKTKINSVLLRGVNDQEFFDLVNLAKEYPVDVRFIEIMPIGSGQQYEGYSRQELITLLEERYPGGVRVSEIRGNGPADYIHFPDFKGCIGFIDAIHGKFCNSCNRVRLTADGMLKLCLYYQNGIDLKHMVRTGEPDDQIRKAMEQAILKKPVEHQFHMDAREGAKEIRRMSQIGG